MASQCEWYHWITRLFPHCYQISKRLRIWIWCQLKSQIKKCITKCMKLEGNVSSILLLASLAVLRCFHKADEHEIENCNLNPSCLIVLFRSYFYSIYPTLSLFCLLSTSTLYLSPFPTTFVLSAPLQFFFSFLPL